MSYKLALLSAVSLSLSLPALAQAQPDEEATTTLDTVIVEGSRLNQTQTEIGSSVSIITADDIDELGFDFALDAIASAPGVTVNQNGSFGGLSTISIRGAATAQTLVLIDGIPVNDTSTVSGGFDFSRLDTENIARIEVLKGPQSTLWGSDAIGGVVSIITKDAEPGLGGSAFLEAGSFNTFRGGASIGNATDAGDFRLAITGNSSDGISKADENNGNDEDDPYESVTVSAKGGLNFGEARLAADALWSDADSKFDSFVFGAQGNVGDGDQLNQTEEFSSNISLTAPLLDGRLENLLVAGYSEIDRQNFTNGVPSFSGEGDRTLLRYQGTLNINDANTFAFGAEREETTTQDQDTSINALFALYELQATDKLTLTGGLRVDDHSSFGTETTGRVAAAFNPTPQLTLRASWGQGFKAPTLLQLSGGGFTLPNPNLQPETSEAFDAGIEWRAANGKADASLTVFDAKIRDQISFASTGYFNESKVDSTGLELTGRVDLTDWASVSGNYAYIDSTRTDGSPTFRVPEHSGEVRLSIDPDSPYSGAILVRYNGEEPNTNGTTLDSWTRVDVTGAYDVSERVEVFGRIENLFDEEYQTILGYGTPDLSGSIGIRLRY
jgi:vitamin B12 transporter